MNNKTSKRGKHMAQVDSFNDTDYQNTAGTSRAQEKRQQSAQEQTGYVAPATNPYLAGLSNGTASEVGHINNGMISNTHKPENKQKRRRKISGKAKIGILVALLLALGVGAFGYMHRPVEIMVDGKRRTVMVNTTVDAIFKKEKPGVKPGNFISVKGKTLKEGEGYPFTLKVGDKTYQGKEAEDFRVHGGESLTFSDGTNVMEDHDTKVVETQPKLTMKGTYGAIAYISQWGQVGKKEVLTGKVSGETADGKVVQELKNCTIQLAMPQMKDNKKLIALTFDDGPSEYTEKYLEILKKYNAKATFFMIGNNVKLYPDKVKEVIAAGHQVACHSYSHPVLSSLPEDKLKQELTSSFDIIDKTTGKPTTALRPPYGAFTEKTWLYSGGSMSMSVLWTRDSEDWRRPGADKIISNAIGGGVKPGDIILMHDGGGPRSQDVEALPTIIERLQKDGYQLVTLSELLANDAHIPAQVAACNDKMPQNAVWPTEIQN